MGCLIRRLIRRLVGIVEKAEPRDSPVALQCYTLEDAETFCLGKSKRKEPKAETADSSTDLGFVVCGQNDSKLIFLDPFGGYNSLTSFLVDFRPFPSESERGSSGIRFSTGFEPVHPVRQSKVRRLADESCHR